MSKDSNTLKALSHWQNFKQKLIIKSILVGAFSGLIAVLYRFTLEKMEHLSQNIYKFQRTNYWFIPLWFILLIALALIVGFIVKKEPMISGSGIPQVEGTVLGPLKMNWLKVAISKFVGGALSILGGLSLGREGPSIQIGAAIGQGVSKGLNSDHNEERYLITSGASAGLAAAFNAPLAGVIFSLEEVHKSFSPLILLSTMTAAITADFTSKLFFGFNTAFKFDNLSSLPLSSYGYLIILGVIIGIGGVIFNSLLVKALNLYNSQKWLPPQFRIIIPFVIAGILGLILPQVLGGGHSLVMSIIEKNPTLKVLFILLIVKFLFTMISFGSGAPGGIFLPLLVIGAIIGSIYGNILVNLGLTSPDYIHNFMILAMAGYLTAIVRAPITGAVLITEMTGSLSHLLSLSIVSIIGYLVADFLGSKPIYETLLHRLLSKEKNNNFAINEVKKTILEIPVSICSYLDKKKIKDIQWPENCLLVGIQRSGVEIIPKGDTYILGGDYLVILADEDKSSNITEYLMKIAYE